MPCYSITSLGIWREQPSQDPGQDDRLFPRSSSVGRSLFTVAPNRGGSQRSPRSATDEVALRPTPFQQFLRTTMRSKVVLSRNALASGFCGKPWASAQRLIVFRQSLARMSRRNRETQHSFNQKLAGKVTSKFKNAVRVTGVFAPNLNVSKPRVAPPSPPLKLYESKLVNLFDPT